jgi:hypothetical protein
MANERSWDSIGPVLFAANGGADGSITVASTSGMRVKQEVIVASTTQPTLSKIEIKRVLSPTKIIVGPIKTTGEFLSRSNLSAYLLADLATVKVIDQKKSKPTDRDIFSFVYEPEPAVAIRTLGVDELGRPWTGENPLPVEGTFVITSDAPTIQRVQNVAMAVANQEYTITLPDGTKRYQIRIRDHASKGRLAFIPTETATNYWEITRGTIIDSYSMNLPINSMFYVSADKANMTLEVLAWVKP